MALYEFRSAFLPYCLKKLPDGRYVVLHRDYKPLGFMTREHIKYEDFPVAVHIKGLTAKVAERLSWKSDPNTDEIFLYIGDRPPTASADDMSAYLKKIEILASLKITS